jgi:hypothetical protein
VNFVAEVAGEEFDGSTVMTTVEIPEVSFVAEVCAGEEFDGGTTTTTVEIPEVIVEIPAEIGEVRVDILT